PPEENDAVLEEARTCAADSGPKSAPTRPPDAAEVPAGPSRSFNGEVSPPPRSRMEVVAPSEPKPRRRANPPAIWVKFDDYSRGSAPCSGFQEPSSRRPVPGDRRA